MSISLPNTYQRVYYIQSSGTQYIDTGVTLNEDIFCELDFSLTETTSSETDIFGADVSPYPVVGTLNSKFRFRVTSAFLSDTISVDTDRHKLFWSSTKITLDGLTLVSGSAGAYSTAYSAYLFAANTSSGANYFSKVRIYSCRIHNKDTGKVIRNFLPCYRKSDGVIGMYDLINDIFYTNSGSGTFIKGDDLNDLSYKNFKLYLGRKTETHEDWVSKTESTDFTTVLWRTAPGLNLAYRHYARYPLGSSSNVKDVVINSYSVLEKGIAPLYKGCIVTTVSDIVYVQIYFESRSSTFPENVVANANFTYSKYEDVTVYIPESYKTILLGGQIFNIKSDIDIVPIPPYVGPSIDDINLTYTAGSWSITVKASNTSNYDIDIVLYRADISTSSTDYDEQSFYSSGCGETYSPLQPNASNADIAYFNGGCELYHAYMTFEFLYQNISLGYLTIEYNE